MVRRSHIFLTMLVILLAPTAHAADERQFKLEAAFLYNFFNYITWPGYRSPDALKDVTICIESGDPVVPYLSYVQQKMAAQRRLNVHNWTTGDSTDGCHVLFSRSGSVTAANGTLTVSARASYINHGGMIGMVQDEGRIGLRINNSLLNEHGFQASSRLLSLAQEVK